MRGTVSQQTHTLTCSSLKHTFTFRTLGCRRQGHAGSWLRAEVTSGVSTAANELQSAFTDWTRRSTCSGSSTFTDDRTEEAAQRAAHSLTFS